MFYIQLLWFLPLQVFQAYIYSRLFRCLFTFTLIATFLPCVHLPLPWFSPYMCFIYVYLDVLLFRCFIYVYLNSLLYRCFTHVYFDSHLYMRFIYVYLDSYLYRCFTGLTCCTSRFGFYLFFMVQFSGCSLLRLALYSFLRKYSDLNSWRGRDMEILT